MPINQQRNFVIAISSISGGGKTSLVRKTAELLPGSILLFDEYRASSHYPQDLGKWLANGADFNEWRTPDFARDVLALRRGESIIAPRDGRVIQPTEYIVIEEPMGRCRVEMEPLIDFAVYIDTPLEIGLARRLARDVDYLQIKDLDHASHEELIEGYHKLFKHVRGYLEYYIHIGRDFYYTIHQKVIATCDLVLDGHLPIDELAKQIVSEVKDR